MKIIAHRGLWTKKTDGNTLDAFKAAFEKGYGIETDVRDYEGRLVVSHNIATSDCFDFEEVLKMYSDMQCTSELAINIKADGLQTVLMNAIKKYKVNNYFVFDMSVPEQVVYHKDGVNVYTRMSEYETVPVLLSKSKGIWMDEWEESWINANIIKKYREEGKRICIISPEIHGRDVSHLWKEMKSYRNDEGVTLCTDIPMQAEEFFNE